MGVEVTSYIDVTAKAESLGYKIPTGLTFLPSNFESGNAKNDMYYESSIFDIHELLVNEGIQETPLEAEGEKRLILLQESEVSEWVFPTLFISFSFVSQNPHLVSVALNLISSYLADWLRKNPLGKNQATLEIVRQKKNGDYEKIEYRGPVEGLDRLPEIIDKAYSQE